MEPPVEPKPEDCCNSGCNPCIFDIYERQLKLYNCNQDNLEGKQENGIYELKYTEFIVVGTKILCDSQKILNFRRYIQNDSKVWWKPGDHFLYKYVSDNVSCTRAYTPFKLQSDKDKNYDFSIVLKCYSNGLVSNHLFHLDEGELTLWRGPYGSYKLEPNTYNRIVMIAQGTGIAPFINIIDAILSNEDDMTKIYLFYCCHSINEILFRDELRSHQCYWNFFYEVFLNKVTGNLNIRYQEPIVTKRFSYEDLRKLKPDSNDQILICGSTKFIDHYNNALRNNLNLVKNIFLF